ncbi:hypothetical protein Egran_01058 [Elaphomyces granulatus]|uniref:Calcium-transporting ATPase n=1 Tax=Elaphomyces granulatus TaxID=519963 RepID=A0A232M479_9EURO|nr:hypothetical protein Egran_01058 [Elaphomyces granulatus]
MTMSDSNPGVDDDFRQLTPVRRERAPTITIDTSAVSPSDVSVDTQNVKGPPQLIAPGDKDGDVGGVLNSANTSPTDAHSIYSSEWREKESRPMSPHNVSSPTARVTESYSHFLSVPGMRSRGNSLESTGSSQSGSLGGDTYIQTTPSESSSQDIQIRGSDVMNDEDSLKPDPGTEKDFEVVDNKFAFSPGQLTKLFNPKSLAAFYALGGLAGLEKGLRTDRRSGLSVDETHLDGAIGFNEATGGKHDDKKQKSIPRSNTVKSTQASIATQIPQPDEFSDRRRVYGTNRLPSRKTKSIWELAWIAYNDKVLILLTAAAAVSLALGIYQSVTATGNEARVQWVEGVAIIVAILIVVVVGAANDWQKERQFVRLNRKKEDRHVKVIRSGRSIEISVYDILVGDVMHLEPGDLVPVDGILIEGHNVKCDESSATGESDVLHKHLGDDVYRTIKSDEVVSKLDPFIISGAKVSEGVGRFLVTSTGVHSVHGRTLLSLQDEGQTTPLQSKLNVLAEYIAKLGLAAGLALFIVLLIKFWIQLGHYNSSTEKGQAFLRIFIVAVTVIVVAVPEGLPLAVTLALAFATTRMLRDNNLVRYLRACETMGNATTICSDKTGTLTQNNMQAVTGTLGTNYRFGDIHSSGKERPKRTQGSSERSPSDFAASLSSSAKELLLQSIVLNSTAFEGEESGQPIFVGSKTETALLKFARDFLDLRSVSEMRSDADIVQMVPFDSSRKCMAVVVKQYDGMYRMFVKGAPEILLERSTRIIKDPQSDVSGIPLTENQRSTLDDLIRRYGDRSLRTLGLLYRDFGQWPPRAAATQEGGRKFAIFDAVFSDMTVLGIIGIQDPLRPGVKESVLQCQRSGVSVRMVTGDNIRTAMAIARECGIYEAGGLAMEGPKFRGLTSAKRDQLIPRLQVLARSSPEDKKLLVERLKKKREIVAVTGDGTNDAPALKTADIGFSMGVSGTEVAKEASDIILMDDNFASIVKAIAWGRTVNDAVKKFLQFQVTVNITAVVLTFVSAVASGDENSVLTAVQLLWINLIMDTFAALALATDPPPASILDRKPEPRSAPLITVTMWKMIIGQSIYQLVVTLVLNFAGQTVFGYSTSEEIAQLQTVIFNTFVWMQIFNQYNCRRIDNHFNIFEGIHRNMWFLGIQLIIVGGQVMIIFVGGSAFSVNRLNGVQWAYSLVLGAISIPVGVIIRLIHDECFAQFLPHIGVHKKQSPQLFVSDEDQPREWDPILEIRDELSFLKKIRGGRLKHIKYRLPRPARFLPRSRSASRSRDNSAPSTPIGDSDGASPIPGSPEQRQQRRTRSRSNSAFGPATAMAGVIAGSIGGLSPIDKKHGDSGRFSSRHSGLDLEEGIEIHPDTAPDDPIIDDDPTLSSSRRGLAYRSPSRGRRSGSR